MLPLDIAFRFITSKKFQSLLLIFGFGIGIGTNIFIGNLIMAIEDDLISRTINAQPHITITNQNTSAFIENHRAIIEDLKEIEEVTIVTKVLEGRAFIVNINSQAPQDIVLRGFNSLSEGNEIYGYYNDKFQGKKPSEPHHIIIGKGMAENLDISLGEKLNISISPFAPIGRILTVTGIFDLGREAPNEMWVIGTNVMSGFVLYNLDKVSSLILQVKDHMKADTVARDIEELLIGEEIKVVDWKDNNEALMNTLTAQSISTKVVQFFILLSVAIAIGSVLSITVVHKQKQVGILKAIGLSDHESGKIFLLQGSLLGALGTLFGVIFGFFMILLFNTFTGDDVVIITINALFTLISVTIGISSAVIASYLPAQTGRNLEIIQIIQQN